MVIFNNETLKQAVKEWIDNPDTAKTKYGHISNWDVTCVTNMSELFFNTTSFNEDIGDWDVSKVTDMRKMFFDAISFNKDIGNWNVSSVIDMSYMFGAWSKTSFNQHIGKWDVSKVINMTNMFFNATSFNQDIGEWNVNSVTNMRRMFYSDIDTCTSTFNQHIGKWDVSKVNNMEGMFAGTSFNQYIGKWDVSKVNNMEGMFAGTSFNQDIGKWDVSMVTNMRSMLNGASLFNQNISEWNVSNVRDMSNMFDGSSSFNQDIGKWDVSNVTDMSKMFSNEESFNTYIGKWDVSKVISAGNPPESNLFKPDLWFGKSSEQLQEEYITEEITIPKQIPKSTIYIIESIQINDVIITEGNEFNIDGFIKCEKWDFDTERLYIFNAGFYEFYMKNKTNTESDILNLPQNIISLWGKNRVSPEKIVSPYNQGKGIVFMCKKLNYIEGSNIPIEDLDPVESSIMELTFNDVLDNNFVLVGGVIVDKEIWSSHRNLFTHLPYDDLTEASDEDEDNFDNTRYFGRCEGSVDTITFVGGTEGFYFTGTYVSDYMEVVREE